jgi:hypothetical protein
MSLALVIVLAGTFFFSVSQVCDAYVEIKTYEIDDKIRTELDQIKADLQNLKTKSVFG